ncbi:MAG: hypothetical protein WB523_04565 [Candidatus Sulfotelmatobacter sp.]
MKKIPVLIAFLLAAMPLGANTCLAPKCGSSISKKGYHSKFYPLTDN